MSMTTNHVIISFGDTQYIVVGCYDSEEEEQRCEYCASRRGTLCYLEYLNYKLEKSQIEHDVLMSVRSVKCPSCGTVFGFREPKRTPDGMVERGSEYETSE